LKLHHPPDNRETEPGATCSSREEWLEYAFADLGWNARTAIADRDTAMTVLGRNVNIDVAPARGLTRVEGDVQPRGAKHVWIGVRHEFIAGDLNGEA
jgi:hypothetical protein